MTAARVLVMAKAPVPGLAKTRLGSSIGSEAAADLAAAALLDTLDACAGFEARYLALTGDLSQASRRDEIAAALTGWVVFEQSGDTFAQRLAHAHRWVAGQGPGGIVQVGMDTPHLSPEVLGCVADALDRHAEVVLGPAEDGGWWVLGLADGRDAAALVGVPMSTDQTHARTVAAFVDRGRRVAGTVVLRDVDTVADAEAVAALAPTTRFARAWLGSPAVPVVAR